MQLTLTNLYCLMVLFIGTMAAHANLPDGYPKVCSMEDLLKGCRPLLVSYTAKDKEGSWMSMDYTKCGGESGKGEEIPAEGVARCIEKGTLVSIGPAHTLTNYLQLPIDNGFYVQCHGMMGSKSANCEVVIRYPELKPMAPISPRT